MSGPLAGIRVLEVGHMLAGPYCGLLLADLGAEGDIGRRVSPHRIGPHNAYFASLNRSKQSVVLDLASDEGQAALGGLARDAHALVTNLRPSAIRKLGLTYDALARHNPRLVCVALTGYGLDGPHADTPAYDYIVQAMTGVMALTGEPDAPPAKAGWSAVDNSAGIMAALGLLAKIVQGKGGQVDVAMFDVLMSQLNYVAGASLNAGETPRRHALSAHPYMVPAQLFRTADGWLTLFVTHDEFWRRFCGEAGRPEWLDDPRFATMEARRTHRDVVLAAVGALLATDTSAGWMRRLAPLGIVAAAVDTLENALAGDLVRERALVVDLPCAEARLRAIGSPIRFSDSSPEYGAPPLLGEHTAAVLGRLAASTPCDGRDGRDGPQARQP